MTANQLQYQALRETQRSNIAKEEETQRSNYAKESETKRHNLRSERTDKANALSNAVKAYGSFIKDVSNAQTAPLKFLKPSLFK